MQPEGQLIVRGRPRRRPYGRKSTPWAFLAPALVVYTGFLLYPAGRSFYYSLTNWNGLSSPRFIGVKNYMNALTSSATLSALEHNGIWSAVMVTVPTALGLFLAVLLNRPGRVRAITQGVAFVPERFVRHRRGTRLGLAVRPAIRVRQ